MSGDGTFKTVPVPSVPECVLQLECTIIAQSQLCGNVSRSVNQLFQESLDLNVEDVTSLVAALIDGEFEQVLTSGIARHILGFKTSDIHSALPDLIKEGIISYIGQTENSDEQLIRQFLVLCVGTASLQLFVQNNWIGPPTTHKPTQFLPDHLRTTDKEKELHDYAKSSLSPDGSNLYPLVCMPELLLLARCILSDASQHITLCKTADWWRLRYMWILQQLLDERSPQIYESVLPLINSVNQNELLMSPERSDLPLLFRLECSRIYVYYYEYSLSSERLHEAKKIAGLDVDLTGALGKRTRFQESDLAQLVLTVKRDDDGMRHVDSEVSPPIPKHLPKDLLLEDDTILNAIKFKDETANQIPNLTTIEQALVLGLCMEHKMSKPKDLLLTEELMTYIVGVLRQPQCWSVQTSGLRVRCQLEKHKRRTVERAMTQMQVLVDQIQDGTCPVRDRFQLFYAVNLPPKWTLEGELADLLISLGCVSAALEIYVRLQLWENVVDCYKILEKPEKAIHVIREQLAIKESALMLCLLGDVTREKKYYEKAWEVSGHRSTKALSSLGLMYLHEKEYAKAIECLETSLEKNFLQYEAWFNLGYAAFKSERYEIAAKAYRRCVMLDAENCQSWNNLASAFIRLNEKTKAYRTLQESLKCNYENWKIWDNFLAVSVDIGEFGEAVKAYNRLLDLKEKYVDEEALGIMVRAVVENLNDASGNPGGRLKPQMLELFGRLTSQVTNNAMVWSLYAKLLGNCTTNNSIENDKALQCLQRAHRLATMDQRWHTDVSKVKEVILQTQQLAQAYHQCSKDKPNAAQAIQLLSSAKLMLKAVISKVKQEYWDPVTPTETWKEFSESVSQLEIALQTLVDEISQLKG